MALGKKKLAAEVLERLEVRYPEPKSALNYNNEQQLLWSVILSAQCTDERVNKVTPALFSRWPEIRDMAGADLSEVEEVVRTTGLFRSKAKSLVQSARIMVERFGGRVPRTMEGLLELPGVGRKTANIVLSNAFGLNQGLAVDTHVKRISFRLGLTRSKDPLVIEKDLCAVFPRPAWGDVNHILVLFGREVCKARTPLCLECELADICPKKGV